MPAGIVILNEVKDLVAVLRAPSSVIQSAAKNPGSRTLANRDPLRSV
jgi:hypothetical protein